MQTHKQPRGAESALVYQKFSAHSPTSLTIFWSYWCEMRLKSDNEVVTLHPLPFFVKFKEMGNVLNAPYSSIEVNSE